MMSLAVLAVTGIGTVSGFMLLNRYASDNRDRNAARFLCQERIEQALTLPYRPYITATNLTKVLPSVTGQDGTAIYPLGKDTDYDNNGVYQGGTQQTSSEAVTISLQPNGTQAAATPVTGTRTTTLSVANATYSLMRVSVNVSWVIRGQTKSYTLYTVRTKD